MTNEDFVTLLETQSVRFLHQLAKGRIPRHLRMGKTRLIQALLTLPRAHHKDLLADIHAFSQSSQPERQGKKPHHRDSLQRIAPQQTGDSSGPSNQELPKTSITTIEALFEGIGVPPAKPIKPDSWQEEAIEKIRTADVIVSVPTGSGKTYVAVEAMRHVIASNQTVIYTSPLKALSNTKLTEFSGVFGTDSVGILTGDRQDNPHAPILIMTTEILRNLLYDASCGEIDMRLDTLGLVIMDESQYLADPERGVVWEETIIFCPSQARLLLLSASIGNPDEVATWMSWIRPTACHLIHHRNRSVPIRGAYLHPNGELAPLFTTQNIVQGPSYVLHPETKRLFTHYNEATLGNRYKPKKR